MNKEPDEAFDYLIYLDTTTPPKNETKSNATMSHSGKYQLREEDDLSARVASLARKLEAIGMRVNEIKSIPKDEVCGICEVVRHSTNDFPTIPIFK